MKDREPTARARHLGRLLVHAMQEKGFTAKQIAAELGWSSSRVSRVLTGKRMVPPVDLAAFVALCGITGPPRDRLLTLAKEVMTQSPWCEEHGPCLPADLPALHNLEGAATSLNCVDTVAVPAIVQTEDYRRALLRATPVIPDAEIAERITVHRTRQRCVLDRHNPPTMRIFLTEQALTDPGADRGVLCDQVHHLLRLAVRPRVEIRMIPARCFVSGVYPSFQLMTFPDPRPVIYLEQLTSTTFLDHPTTIASYEHLLAKIDSIALGPELSRTTLAAIGTDLSEPPDRPDTEAVCDGWLGGLLTMARPETESRSTS